MMGKANFPKNQSKLHDPMHASKGIIRKSENRANNTRLNKIRETCNKIIKRRKGKAKKWQRLHKYLTTMTTRMK